MIQITVDDHEVQAALTRLSLRAQNLQPILQTIGEDIMERAKKRFASSTGPDGARWAANARATVEAFVRSKGHAVSSPRGVALSAHKKPLIGLSGDLRREIHSVATPTSLVVGAVMQYAAIQQFGGKKSAYPHLWGDIPARPFLPIKQNGELYPEDKARILEMLQRYISGGQ